VRRGRTDAALVSASPQLLLNACRWAAAADRDAESPGFHRGGWADAAAFALHHRRKRVPLMAGWHEVSEGTSISATNRLRSLFAAWWRRVRA